jgi:hypothetical protein
MDIGRAKKIFDPRGGGVWLPGRDGGAMALLFLLLISLPLLESLFNVLGPFDLVEKRKLADKPAFDVRRPWQFPERYEAYFNDHFAFRTRLVHWNNLLTYKIFSTSASAKVVIGKAGWLFLGNHNKYFDEVDYYRNVKPFTFGELRRWQAQLEARRNWLRRRGIQYIFTVAPNKSTIYPEYMPDAIRKIHSASRLDQLIAHMEKHSTVRVLDLRPALREAKKVRPAYYRTDTHWNDWGAYVAYREIIACLQPHFAAARPRSPDAYALTPSEFRNGDLALMISLPGIFRETQWRITAKFPLRARVLARAGGDDDPRPGQTVHVCPEAPLPPALMVHDSFAHPMKQFLSEEFVRTVYIWNWALAFFDRVIERENVKIVIDQMAEFSMLSRFPLDSPVLGAR